MILKNVLCVGPLPEPITGQSFAFESFVNNSQHEIYTLNLNLTGKPFFLKLILALSVVLRFLFLIFTQKLDVLYITTSRSNLGFLLDSIFILFFLLFTKKPKIVNHLHGADFASFRELSKLRFLIDYVYSKIDVSIVLCERMKEQYFSYNNMKVVSVSNFSSTSIAGVDAEIKQRHFVKGNFKLLYFSNLMYSKGVVVLLDAVSNLIQNGYDIELTLAGKFLTDEFMDKEELRNKVDLYLSENIKYIGVVNGEQKTNILNESNIFCLPTFYKTEAQPISIIEAMAHCNIVVTTRHNYNEDFLDEDEVVFVHKNDVEELEAKLTDIFQKREHYLCYMDKAYKRARSELDLKFYVTSIDEIIKEI